MHILACWILCQSTYSGFQGVLFFYFSKRHSWAFSFENGFVQTLDSSSRMHWLAAWILWQATYILDFILDFSMFLIRTFPSSFFGLLHVPFSDFYKLLSWEFSFEDGFVPRRAAAQDALACSLNPLASGQTHVLLQCIAIQSKLTDVCSSPIHLLGLSKLCKSRMFSCFFH